MRAARIVTIHDCINGNLDSSVTQAKTPAIAGVPGFIGSSFC
jgi:hypothetical protein